MFTLIKRLHILAALALFIPGCMTSGDQDVVSPAASSGFSNPAVGSKASRGSLSIQPEISETSAESENKDTTDDAKNQATTTISTPKDGTYKLEGLLTAHLPNIDESLPDLYTEVKWIQKSNDPMIESTRKSTYEVAADIELSQDHKLLKINTITLAPLETDDIGQILYDDNENPLPLEDAEIITIDSEKYKQDFTATLTSNRDGILSGTVNLYIPLRYESGSAFESPCGDPFFEDSIFKDGEEKKLNMNVQVRLDLFMNENNSIERVEFAFHAPYAYEAQYLEEAGLKDKFQSSKDSLDFYDYEHGRTYHCLSFLSWGARKLSKWPPLPAELSERAWSSIGNDGSIDKQHTSKNGNAIKNVDLLLGLLTPISD